MGTVIVIQGGFPMVSIWCEVLSIIWILGLIVALSIIGDSLLNLYRIRRKH